MLVIADNEPAKYKRAVLQAAAKEGIEAKVDHLEVGDYVFDDCLCIERKTVPDYIKSLSDGRLMSQVLDMQQYAQSCVIISGSFKEVNYNPHFKAFRVEHKLGSQGSVLFRTKVKLWQVDNKTQFIKALFLANQEAVKGPKTYVVERHSCTLNRLDPNLASFLSIPTVGEKTANQLKSSYATYGDLLMAVKLGVPLRVKLRKDAVDYLTSILPTGVLST